jgi:hypothetical protein
VDPTDKRLALAQKTLELAKTTKEKWLSESGGDERLASVRLYCFALSWTLRAGMEERALVDVMFTEIRDYLREMSHDGP